MDDKITPANKAPGDARRQRKDEVRGRIGDALIALLAEGRIDINHDLVADRAGLGRRTVYRYFPDREALLEGALERVRALAGPYVTLPQGEKDLTEALHAIHTGFDKIAPIVTLMRSTPQGRATRLAGNDARMAAYTSACADLVRDLSEADQRLAVATLQMLHTSPWLEMRDHWGLSGEEIATAIGWAMRALIEDLRRRHGRPLDEPAVGGCEGVN